MVGFRTCRVHCCKSLWQKSCYFIWPTTPTWTLYAMKILKNLSQRTPLQCNRKQTPTILASGPLQYTEMPFRFSEEEKKFLVFQILTGNRFHFSERFDFILIRSESETPTKLASVYGHGATSTGSWKRNKNNKNAGILTKIIVMNWWKNAEINVVQNSSQMYCIFLYFNYP